MRHNILLILIRHRIVCSFYSINNPSAYVSFLSLRTLSLSLELQNPPGFDPNFGFLRDPFSFFWKKSTNLLRISAVILEIWLWIALLQNSNLDRLGNSFIFLSLILKGFWWFSRFRNTHERVGQAGYFFEFQPFCHQNYHLFAVPLIKIIQAVIKIKINRFFE